MRVSGLYGVAGVSGKGGNFVETMLALAAKGEPIRVVADQVTLHAGSTFNGIVFGQTGITMQTSAAWTGRALAQSLVALDDNIVTAP